MVTDELRSEIEAFIASNAYGWCTVQKAVEMASVIVDAKPNRCVELGVYGGRSLIPQAMALRHNENGHIVGIDPWIVMAATEGDSDPMNEEWWRKQDLAAVRAHAEDCIRRNGLEAYCSTIPWRGENVVNAFSNRSIDMLHIDGNHTELASVRDVNLWLPKVSSGGFIWFDDIDWSTTQAALRILDGECYRVRDVIGENTHARLYMAK